MLRDSRSHVPKGHGVVDPLTPSADLLGGERETMGTRLEKLLSEYEALKRRYEITKDQLYEAEKQNEKLVAALQDARTQIEALKEEVDKLCAPPNTYGVFQRANKDGTVEILVDGRQMR